MNLKDTIWDIIFPRRCLGCDILLDEEYQSYICQQCLKAIPFAKSFACAFCKSPVKNGKTCPYCAVSHYLNRLWVATSYENPLVEKILKTIKYRFVRTLADDISGLMIGYLKKRLITDIISKDNQITVVPVPLNRRRFNWRGFNQSEIIANRIAQFFGWPLVADALTRVRRTKPQADMPDRFSRIKNMRNVFKISPNYQSSTLIDCPQDEKVTITGKTILLIDDISTTSSTLNDCARALRGAGAKEVIGFVFARNKV